MFRTSTVNAAQAVHVVIHVVIHVQPVPDVSVLVNVNSCQVVVTVRSQEYWLLSTQVWSSLILAVPVQLATLINTLEMIVLLARLEPVRVVEVWDTQLFKAQVIVSLSAVEEPSGAVEKSQVTVVFVLTQAAFVKSLVLDKNCALIRLSGL